VKRSAPLERQNGVVTQTQAANRQREVASWRPSMYGQDDEAEALNEISSARRLQGTPRVTAIDSAKRNMTAPTPSAREVKAILPLQAAIKDRHRGSGRTG
jgi:hypothetical protein